MKFFDIYQDTRKTRNRLPHFQQDSGTYFITYRLNDSVPKELMDEWKAERNDWIESHPKPWDENTEEEYHRIFSLKMDLIMDKGHGACVLREGCFSAIIEESFSNFEEVRYDMHSWVVMPNHVHVLLTLKTRMGLEKVVGSWKNYTATKINQALGQGGAFWQKDYFDRMIRDWYHFSRVARYIRKNPVKAKLEEGEYRLFEDEIVKRVLR